MPPEGITMPLDRFPCCNLPRQQHTPCLTTASPHQCRLPHAHALHARNAWLPGAPMGWNQQILHVTVADCHQWWLGR